MIIKLKMLSSINMGGKKRTKNLTYELKDSTGAFERITVGSTYLRRFEDGNLCVIKASILLG